MKLKNPQTSRHKGKFATQEIGECGRRDSSFLPEQLRVSAADLILQPISASSVG